MWKSCTNLLSGVYIPGEGGFVVGCSAFVGKGPVVWPFWLQFPVHPVVTFRPYPSFSLQPQSPDPLVIFHCLTAPSQARMGSQFRVPSAFQKFLRHSSYPGVLFQSLTDLVLLEKCFCQCHRISGHPESRRMCLVHYLSPTSTIIFYLELLCMSEVCKTTPRVGDSLGLTGLSLLSYSWL